ncbi:hypothetical protein D3C85_1265090 [compost metagenome]
MGRRHAAGVAVHRNLGHLRQRARPGPELQGHGHAVWPDSSGLEGPARAGQRPASGWLRRRNLRIRARCRAGRWHRRPPVERHQGSAWPGPGRHRPGTRGRCADLPDRRNGPPFRAAASLPGIEETGCRHERPHAHQPWPDGRRQGARVGRTGRRRTRNRAGRCRGRSRRAYLRSL